MPLIEPMSRCRKFNLLSVKAQWFYLQLKTVLDQAGRHDADYRILNSALFPLRKDVRPSTDIPRWMAECQKAGLLRCYTDLKSRTVVEVFGARQTRLRSIKSEFDDPEGQMPLLGESPPRVAAPKQKGREGKGSNNAHAAHAGEATRVTLDSKTLSTGNAPGSAAQEFAEAAIPTWDEVKTYADMHGVTEEVARSLFNHHEDNNLWRNRFNRLIEWKKKLITWQANDKQYKSKKYGNNNSSGSGGKGGRGAASRTAGTLNAGADYDAFDAPPA